MKVKWPKLAIMASALMLAIPLSAASASKSLTTTAAKRTVWKSETISGKIINVDTDQNLVVVETADGVPFDVVVTAKTRIKSGDQGMTLTDLTRDTNKNVRVTFTPERRGDVAKSIQIDG